MDETASGPGDLLRRSRAGDQSALGAMLEQHRAYLKILARRKLSPRLLVRLDESDIIQQTFLHAHLHIGQFEGTETAEFAAWLLRIMDRCLQEAVRDHTQLKKRAVGREVRQFNADGSDDDPQATLEYSDPSPSQRAMLGEEAVRLASGMEQLPFEQREAVRLRYLEGWPLRKIAEMLEKPPDAVAGLLKRGLVNLRQILNEH